jgi:hypothetical protein
VRPADLVGAITGEAAVGGDMIGAIEIADRHSLVDVRETVADDVLNALRAATIRGRRVTVSRYRPPRTKRPHGEARLTPSRKGPGRAGTARLREHRADASRPARSSAAKGRPGASGPGDRRR